MTLTPLLSRLTWGRTFGLVVDDHWIALSVTAVTLLGRREIFRDVRECDNVESGEVVLEQMLHPWIGRGSRREKQLKPWVQLGVPESKVFQAVVPITQANRGANAYNLFLEAAGSVSVRSEERIYDLLKFELNKRPLACVASCVRSVVADLVEMLDRLGTRVAVAEPVPAALLRAGTQQKKTPRGSKLCLRVFLGPERGLGVVAVGNQVLLWHGFDLSLGEETAAVLAVCSTLRLMARSARLPVSIGTIIVHGRPELEFAQDLFRERIGAGLLRSRGPDYAPADAALGVALANSLVDHAGHDLARTLKPPFAILDIFPWGELLLQTALIAGVMLFLMGITSDLNSKLRVAQAELATIGGLEDHDQAKLNAEKQTLRNRDTALQAYLKSRVAWSGLLRTIAADMPDNTVVKHLSCSTELAKGNGGAGAGKKSLIADFVTRMTSESDVPPEIETFVRTIRGEPVLKSWLATIEVTTLKPNSGGPGGDPYASYSIICDLGADAPKVAAAKVKE